MFIHPSIHLSIHLSVYLPMYFQSSFHQYVKLSFHQSVYPCVSVCPSVCLNQWPKLPDISYTMKKKKTFKFMCLLLWPGFGCVRFVDLVSEFFGGLLFFVLFVLLFVRVLFWCCSLFGELAWITHGEHTLYIWDWANGCCRKFSKTEIQI